MRRSTTLIRSLLALAMVAAASACGSDSPTAPSTVTTQQAFSIFSTLAADTTGTNFEIGLAGEIAAALGAAVVDLPLTVNGQSETFHMLAVQARADSSGVPLDSLIIVVGWRGDNATEAFLVSTFSDTAGSGRSGYPIGEVNYVKDATLYADAVEDGSIALQATPTSGSCTPASVGNDLFMNAIQAERVSCVGATFTGGYSGDLIGDTDDVLLSFSLAGMTGSAVTLDSQQGIFNRAPAPVAQLLRTFRARRLAERQ